MGSRMIQRATSSDLRRRVRDRRAAERIVRLAAHLPPHDQALLLAVYRDGHTRVELALLMHRPPRFVSRRVAGLVRRVRSPLYRFVAQRHDALPPAVLAVARHRVLAGRSLRDTARETRLPLYTVRMHLQTLRTLARYLPSSVDIVTDESCLISGD